MRHRPTRALLALLAPLGTFGCSDPAQGDSPLLDQLERVWAPSGQGVLAPAPKGCRSVVSQRSVRVAGADGESSCQFDSATSQLRCRTALGRSGEIMVSEFASVADFVEAGEALGKVTSLREVRHVEGTALVTSHQFDELGRLIGSTEERPEGDVVYTYADFDAAGRPRQAVPSRATRDAWGCEAPPFALRYDDAARTLRYQYQPAAHCDQPGYSVLERFDLFGQRMRLERESPAGVETTFEAGAPAATQTLCE
jgi:hypothetical protein